MVELYIYIDDVARRIELMSDEKISVTSSSQNLNDIGKIFTDYSQTFTVPASPNNNSIFSHWYESDIENGFDARVRYKGYIEIDTIPFRSGFWQLEKVNKRGKFIESYALTFYGNLTQLKDKFKEDRLNILDYSSLNHTYTYTEIINRISTSTAYDVRYPLIGSDRKFEYMTGLPYDVTYNAGAITWNKLFPAIKVKKIFEFIEDYYGITFTGSLLNHAQFTNLWLYLKNTEDINVYTPPLKINFTSKVNASTGTPPFDELNLTTDVLSTNWNFTAYSYPAVKLKSGITITPDSGYSSVPYRLVIYNNTEVWQTYDNLMGVTAVDYLDVIKANDDSDYNFTYYIESSGAFAFTSAMGYDQHSAVGYIHNIGYSTSQTTSNQINIKSYIPDIRVADFFMGIVKMLNLMITPIDATTFKLQPLELYYQEGVIKDLTKYIDANDADIERPKLYKNINFKYETSPNVLNNAFRGLFNREYGDLVYDNPNSTESSTYEIKLPFENVMFEKNSSAENFLSATLWDKDLHPYVPKPMILYGNGITVLSADPVKIEHASSHTSITQYYRFSNEINLAGTDLQYLYSLNFGEEVSPYYLVNSPKGLYKTFYEKYIANLYNDKTRILKTKAFFFNTVDLTDLQLNDRVVIRDKRYIINTQTSDITTSDVNFELINDYRVLAAPNAIGYKFASVPFLQVDNTAQSIDIIIYKGMFKLFNVTKSVTGMATWIDITDSTDDYILTVTVLANSSGLDRTKVLTIDYEDYEGNIISQDINMFQYA